VSALVPPSRGKREALVPTSFTVAPADLDELDALAEELGYRSRSEVVRAWLAASRAARAAR